MVWVAVVVGLQAVVLVWEGVPALLGSEAAQTLRARLTQSQLHKGKMSVGDGGGEVFFWSLSKGAFFEGEKKESVCVCWCVRLSSFSSAVQVSCLLFCGAIQKNERKGSKKTNRKAERSLVRSFVCLFVSFADGFSLSDQRGFLSEETPRRVDLWCWSCCAFFFLFFFFLFSFLSQEREDLVNRMIEMMEARFVDVSRLRGLGRTWRKKKEKKRRTEGCLNHGPTNTGHNHKAKGRDHRVCPFGCEKKKKHRLLQVVWDPERQVEKKKKKPPNHPIPTSSPLRPQPSHLHHFRTKRMKR